MRYDIDGVCTAGSINAATDIINRIVATKFEQMSRYYRNPADLELRWEFEGVGQGHYVNEWNYEHILYLEKCFNCGGHGEVKMSYDNDGYFYDRREPCPVCQGDGWVGTRKHQFRISEWWV